MFNRGLGLTEGVTSPGILSISSLWMRGTMPNFSCMAYHLSAMFIGVVRQLVNRSAGSWAFMGRISLAAQAARCIQFL